MNVRNKSKSWVIVKTSVVFLLKSNHDHRYGFNYVKLISDVPLVSSLYRHLSVRSLRWECTDVISLLQILVRKFIIRKSCVLGEVIFLCCPLLLKTMQDHKQGPNNIQIWVKFDVDMLRSYLTFYLLFSATWYNCECHRNVCKWSELH